MFPSANYFRDIPCPFFSRVACPRPHCHFKHVQASSPSSLTTSSTISSPAINIPPDANETLNKLINQLSTAAAASSATTTNPTPAVDLTSIFQNTLLQSLTTVFNNAIQSSTSPSTTNNNEISEKLTQAISNIATQLHQHQTPPTPTANSAETVLEYRPTPLAELERRKRVHQHVPIKSEPREFDSDEYTLATFSPPSSSPPPPSHHQPEPVKDVNLKAPIIPRQSQPSVTDDKHSWVTPPVRRKLSSSSDHNDFDERKSLLGKKGPASVKTQPLSKPIATVKPNVIANPTKVTIPTDPMQKRIPKKTTSTQKLRVMDIDLDRVPVTSSISLDIEANSTSKATPTSLKRPANGGQEVPLKKARVIPSTKASITSTNPMTNKKKVVTPNGASNKITVSDEDDELALFDQAFAPSKKATVSVPLNPIQQLTARYTSSASMSNNLNSAVSAGHTRAETSTDGRRIAHKPKVQSTPSSSSVTPSLQPLMDPNSSINKIPFKTRQEYLTFFLNELKKRPGSATVAASLITRAQTIEKEIFDKSTNKNSYLNLAAKHLRQLRSEEASSSNKTETISPKKPSTQRLVVSHSAMLTSGNTDNLSFGIKKQKEVDIKTLTDNELYTLLLVYKASEKELLDNGYPSFSLDFPDKVLIKNRNPVYSSTVKVPLSDPNTRICCRCGQTYKITNEAEYVKQEECIHHWGRVRTQRVAGQIDKTYSCCSQRTNSAGCAIAPYHVHNGDDTQLLSGFVKTQPPRKQSSVEESFGIFALDCEMCYTINGLELVRVSVVNHKLQSVYETLVKPHQKVLDYNTRWSGITEHQLQDCRVTIEDVQRRLLKLFSNKSILIGHSLESDLKALKVVHETIIDTSLVFPHARGQPYKRALRTLMAENLTKIIQENNQGHDSIEDAISCMELMLWKVKQDLKTNASSR